MNRIFVIPLCSLFKRTLPGLALAVLLFSCNQHPKQPDTYQSPAYAKSDKTKPRFTRDMVDNIKDPSCGMPLAAGFDDTLHYKGKVYGFCSDECRDEFKKNPEALAKAAVMKK